MRPKISVGWSYSPGRSDDGPMTDVLAADVETCGEDNENILVRIAREGINEVKMYLSWKMNPSDIEALIERMKVVRTEAVENAARNGNPTHELEEPR